MKRKTIIIFGLLLLCGALFPSPGNESIKFEHLSIEQGLSQNTVFCTLQDSKGFMWFGTFYGLNKYDGKHFTVYTYSPNGGNSLSHPYVKVIHEAPDGILWIGTIRGGLNKFSPKTETFTHYKHDPANPQSLGNNSIEAIHQAPSGILWIGTRGGGLNRFDPGSPSPVFTRYRNDPRNPDSLIHDDVQCIVPGSPGVLWIGTKGGLDKFEPGTGTFTHYRHSDGNPNGLNGNSITCIHREPFSGILWIGTESGGLHKFSPKTGDFTHYTHNPGDDHGIGCDYISCIYKDSFGALWIGTGGGGLNRFDPVNEHFTRFYSDPLNPYSLSSNFISSIFEDRSGVLWFGTQEGGINKFDRNRKKFAHTPPNMIYPGGTDNNSVWAIYQDRRGMLWIGTTRGGLHKLNRKTKTSTRYKPGHYDHFTVKTILEDQSGTIWLGSREQGLHAFDPRTETFTAYRHDPANPNSIAHNNITAIAMERSGLLWLGGAAGGLATFDPGTGTFTRLQHNPENPRGLNSNLVFAVYLDRDEIPWIGTREGGLNKYDRETGTFAHYLNIPEDPATLSDNDILCIYEDSSGILWVGTWGGGLNRFDRETETFTHYTTKDGLPNNMIYGILEDGEGNLWLSSNKGLSRFNPSTGACRNYGPRSGLQSYEFNGRACFKTPEGEMFFGGLNGFNSFFPEKITNNPKIPPVVITDFKLLNKSVAVDGDSPLQEHVAYVEEIELSYRDNIFSLEFSALDYTAPGLNRYKYKMEGLRDQWIDLGEKHDITFTNLDPGDYVFRVKGCNNDGVWNEQGALLKIIIKPPFWETWWFRAHCVLILAALFSLWHRSRMKHLSLKLKTESELKRFFEKYNISKREEDILQLMLKGKSNKEIEEELFISIKTVSNHVYRIYQKLGVKNRLELLHLVHRSAKLN